MKESSRITEISLVIYPRKVWVINMIGVDDYELFIKSISKKFCNKRIGGGYKELYDGYVKEEFHNIKASVLEARNSKDDIGIIVFLLDECDTGAIVHESVHIADYVFESLGMSGQNFSERNEQYAYLVEYIFNKINQIYERS